MKTLFLSLVLALAVDAVGVSAQTQSAPLPATEPERVANGVCPMCQMGGVKTEVAFKQGGEKQDETEKAVLDLEEIWCHAEANHDVAFLEKVEADGFVFTDSTGKVTTKKDEIAEAKQGGEPIRFKLSDMKAHVYGSAAVVTGLTTFGAADTGGNAQVAYRWTDVFVKQANGEWQVVASQATAVGDEKTGGEQPGVEKPGE